MLTRIFVFALMLSSSIAYSKTVSSVAISPQGAVLVAGSNLQYTALCTYSDGTTDNCAAAGGATWSTPTTAMTVNSSGLASWNASYDPHNATLFPQGAQTAEGIVRVTAGGQGDTGQLLAESPTDTFYIYMTPDPNFNYDPQSGSQLPANVVVGATVAIGAGFTSNAVSSGNPFQMTCNWSSSNNAVATITRYGLATAIAPGNVTITCGAAGNGKFGTGSGTGNTYAFNVVAPTPSNQTWYVRPSGGTPFISSSQTPAGQCDGKHDADYPGTGVNQPCALGNLRYLWTDQVTPNKEQWIIGSGDTVIVRQKAAGYNLGMDAQSPDYGGTTGFQPINCGNPDCFMPTIPSGTAAQHTKILGENYGSCHVDSAKTKVLVSWGSKNGINVKDSQFVDVQCLDISDSSACAYNASYTNNCPQSANQGLTGVLQSALTSNVNYTDLFIHGLSFEGIRGAAGANVVANYVHIRAMPSAGIDMDDAPHNLSNISVAGGFTLNNSTTEFTGCVEEYPVVHNYPYIECRDSETGGYGDGFGTASTTGTWSFDHDIWRYNFQDGLDMLHANMQNLSVTNSQSYGNDGNQYKIGAADTTVLFQNNTALANCERILQVIGDEPASAIVQGVNPCRAGGGPVVLQFSAYGTYTVRDNSIAGYADTNVSYGCSSGNDNCSTATTTFQNNVLLGYANTNFNGNEGPATFCPLDPSKSDCNNFLSNYPANQGWGTRSNNLYYNTRTCPKALTAGETCNTLNPLFANQPASPISPSTEPLMDNYNFVPSSSSPLIGAGIGIAGLLVDLTGLLRPNPPSIGAMEYAAGTTLATSLVAVTATPNPATTGQSVTLTATVALVGTVQPTGTVTFASNGTSVGSGVLNASGTATFSLSTLAAGTDSITATYSGDSKYAAGASNATTVTINGAAKTASTTALTASPNPATTAQAITLTSTVTATSGTPTGTVAFFDGTVSLGSSAVNGAGVATIQVASLTAGSHSLTAQYSGNTTLNASTSLAVVETVTASATATTTSLTASPNPATTTQAVSLVATVTATSGTPTGTITFFDGAVSVGTGAVNGSGVATLQAPAMTAGLHTLTAQYSGNTTLNASTSAAFVETVNAPGAAATATSLVASLNPATTTQAVVLTATVTTATGTPAGTVTFFDGATLLGSATLSGAAVASIQVPSFTAGIHNLTAHYAGNATLNASVSPAVVETVNAPAAAATVTSLITSPNPATTTQAIVLTATVTTATGTPTGTVTFFDGATLLGSATLNGAAVASIQVPSFTAGIHNLTAHYAGNTTLNASVSPTAVETINAPAAAATITSLITSPNPATTTQAVTLVATVTTTSGTPTGTVAFFDGSTSLGTAIVNGSGLASLQVPSFAAGSHSLTAQYAGNTTLNASSSAVFVETVNAPAPTSTTTSLVASPNPATTTQAVTLTATVTATSGTPTGTITFSDGSTSLGSATINGSGAATIQVPAMTAGLHNLTAHYSGNTTLNASTSALFVEIVNAPAAAATITSLVTSLNPVVTAQAVALTATVTTASGHPTGTVTFFDGGTSLGSATLNGSGVATLQVPSFTAGLHSLTAQYAGSTSFNASASSAVTEIVNEPALIPTTTLLQASSTQIVLGQTVTLTATVAVASGTSTGTISFLDGSTSLGSAAIVSGVATIQVPSLAVGSHNLTAQYAGNSTFNASASSGVTVTVTAASLPATTTTLEISQNPSPTGQSVTLTSKVTSASGTPTGTVSFLNNGVAFGSASVDGNGAATYTAQALPPGTYPITAQYAGSSAFNTSTSTSVSWTILASGVTLALSTPSLTVPSGVAASNPVTLTLTPFGGYTGTLQMACQSPTPTATCSFQPQTVTLSSASGPTNVTMVVQTSPTVAFAAPHDRQQSLPGKSMVLSASIFWIPGILAAALVGRKRKLLTRSAHLLLLLLLCGVFGAMTGCGAGDIDPLATSSSVTALKIMVTGTGVSQTTVLNITSK